MTLIVIDPFVWIEPVAYLSERKVCACVKMSKCHFTIIMSCVQSTLSELRNVRHSDQIRLSDKFGFRLNFGLGHALFLTFYLNQIRNFYYFLVKTCSHHNICHHHKHKKFFKISFLALRGKKYLQNWSRKKPPLQLRSEDELPRVQVHWWTWAA